ncbi:hypothetical protein TSUD_209930 [Trifolium subterraneum]|uniref:Uncharacterized protein n=1 Tax=Trifolium subterraneum TaxID=3900 RepID=A0A2Z6MRY1_TRISU|nr:hypothetical protein TSUD_209930 [Trifolium subterraneum]
MDVQQQNSLKHDMQHYGNESNKWSRIIVDPELNLENFTAQQLSRAREINNLRIGMQRHERRWTVIRADDELGLCHRTPPHVQQIEDVELDGELLVT